MGHLCSHIWRLMIYDFFLKTSFDAGQKDLSEHDPHTIAGCIKMYLRELPEPLLKFDLYSEWLKAAG